MTQQQQYPSLYTNICTCHLSGCLGSSPRARQVLSIPPLYVPSQPLLPSFLAGQERERSQEKSYFRHSGCDLKPSFPAWELSHDLGLLLCLCFLPLISALGTLTAKSPVSLVRSLNYCAGVYWKAFKWCSWSQDFQSTQIHLETFKCM